LYIKNNIDDFAKILIQNNFSKIIFTSTTAVYDNHGNINPKSVYAMTKLAGEQLAKIYCKHCWILRITNPFGPNDKKSVFAKLAEYKRSGNRFPIYASNAKRDFFHVEHIATIVKSILRGRIKTGTYNVGSGVPTEVRQLLIDLCQAHHIKYKFVYPPQGLSDSFVPGSNNLLTRKNRSVKDEWRNSYLPDIKRVGNTG
jgi:nucleoside-diphosphate-sugar epimerase